MVIEYKTRYWKNINLNNLKRLLMSTYSIDTCALVQQAYALKAQYMPSQQLNVLPNSPANWNNKETFKKLNF